VWRRKKKKKKKKKSFYNKTRSHAREEASCPYFFFNSHIRENGRAGVLYPSFLPSFLPSSRLWMDASVLETNSLGMKDGIF
jgi:hypothetical protein